MKIEIIEGKFIISGDTAEERQQLEALVSSSDKSIFQLKSTENSITLVNLGNKETACNTAINVMFSSEDIQIQMISNLGRTSFVMDGVQYESVEGFWQSLKFEEAEKSEIRQLSGKAAKKAGNREKYKKFVHYNGQKTRVGSREHWDLMRSACEHKFNQNKRAQEALLDTGIRPLYHKPRKDSIVIPGSIMAEIWMSIRSNLRKEKGLTSNHLDLLE